MKNSLILLAGAAALSLASCSSDNSTASTTAADGTTTTTTTTTTTGAESDAAIEARAQRIADKMVADMKITDEATKTKIRTVYVNRARRMGELRTKYTADTTGMAAAMREAGTETDTEFKTIFTDPTQYQAYESSRTTYDDSNYMDDASTGTADGGNMSGTDNSAMSSDASTAGSTDASAGSAGSGTNVSKMKVKADGDVKVKDTEGNKMKMDGDDGTMKAKPAGGGKTKVE
jgi:hypothetical protein